MAQRFKPVYSRVRFATHGWTPQEMEQAGTGFIKNGLLPRLHNGLSTSDVPAPPLKKGYAEFKVRYLKKQPIRDLDRTGRTIRSMTVLTAGANICKIGLTDAVTNARVFYNSRIVRQFGVSPHDQGVIANEFSKLPSPIKIVRTTSGKTKD
jgi:hypothetical protein